MNRMYVFLEGMEFWTWLSLIVTLLGVLNAFLIWTLQGRHSESSPIKRSQHRILLAVAGSLLFGLIATTFNSFRDFVYPIPNPTPSPSVSPSPTWLPTPSPTPMGTPTPPKPIGQVIEEELKKFTNGQFLFNVPDEMKQGVPDRIEARISAKKLDETLVSNLKGRGTPYIEDIKVSNIMKVSLISENDAFKITNLSSEEQIVTGRDYAQWDWSVTPLSYGEQSLHFKVSATVKVEGFGEKAVDVPIIDKKVNVTISPMFIISSTVSAIPWWQYVLGGTTLSGVVLAIIARLRKKKRKRAGFV